MNDLRTRLREEAGFALVEVMVSAVLVVVIGTATLSLIDRSGTAAATNRQRAVAVTLAQDDQDAMRLMSLDQLNDRHATTPKVVGGTTYAVKSDTSWIRDSGGVVTCSADSTRVEYLKTTSQVTWPGHPAPVVLESYISPGVGALAQGALTVKLHADSGAGTPNVPVTAGTQTKTTDADGCAVFTNLDPGTVAVSYDGTGSNFVGRNGEQTAAETSTNVVIGSGQTSQVDKLWDKAGRIPVAFVDEANNPVTWNSASVSHNSITNPASQVINRALDTSKAIPKLFPFVAPYSVFAGACANNNPSVYASGYSSVTRVVPAGGDASTATLTVPTLQIGAMNGSTYVNGLAYSVKPAASMGTGCQGSSFGTTASGNVPTSVTVPYGVYSVCVQTTSGTNKRSITRTVNVTPSGSSASYLPTKDVTGSTTANVSVPGTYAGQGLYTLYSSYANVACPTS